MDETRTVYTAIIKSWLVDLREDLFATAVRYARLRTDWQLADPERRTEIDAALSIAHTAFIDSCDILSRNMALHGEDNSWRDRIGMDRRSIGDFACRLHCLLGLLAR